ncbi:MAG: hypothetical protein Q8N22_00095, partial [bacterium]|nr:hypothetical protein [bacterium]
MLGCAASDVVKRYRCSDGATNTVLGTNEFDLGSTNQYYSAMVNAPDNFGGYANQSVWATSLRNNFVARLALNDVTSVASGGVTQYATELNPMGIDLVGSGAGGKIAFTNYGSNSMNLMTPNTGATTSYDTQSNPWGVSNDSVNSKIWVANSSSGSFMKFNSDGSSPVVYLPSVNLDKYYFSRKNATTTGADSIAWFIPEFCPFTLYSPNGSENWVIGTNVDITWKYADSLKSNGGGTSSVHRVKLEISINGTDWYGIPGASSLDISYGYDPAISNDGKFTWNNLPASITGITNLIGATLKVKITDIESGFTGLYDVSNNNFNIKGVLTVDTPPIAEPNIWKLGQTKDITWSTKGKLNDTGLTPHDMTIYLATDGVTFNHTLTATADPGTDGSSNNPWSWANIPSSIAQDPPNQATLDNVIGTNNKIKIKYNYVSAGTVESISNAFTLKGVISNVRVTDTGGTTLTTCLRGGAYKVKWDKKGYFGSGINDGLVDIYYSQDTGASYPTLLVAGTAAGTDGGGGSWDWTIPVGFSLTPDTFKSEVKVIQSTDSTVYNDTKTNASDFDVKSGTLAVTAPGNGATWNIGTLQHITWDYTGYYTTVKISLSRDNGADSYDEVLASLVTASTRDYPWPIVVPPLTTTAKIKVESTQYPDVFALSSGNFTIAGGITVTSPLVTDIWEIGLPAQNITWSTTGTFSTVNIYVSRDSGGSWGLPIVSGYSAAGIYPWTVAAPGTQELQTAKVKIESTDFPQQTITATSELFKIRETIHVDVPSSTGIIWRVGTSQNIQWSIAGSLPGNMVDIYYKKLEGGAWALLAGFPGAGYQANNGSGGNTYSWAVPNDIHDEVYIKVQDHSRVYINDVSDNSFKIKGLVSVTAPSLDEVVKVSDTGESKTIAWSLTGDVTGKADVLLSLTGGAAYPITLTTGVVNINNGSGAGSYIWTVLPAHMGVDNKILVQATTDPGLAAGTAGESASFKVKPQIKLTYPNGLGITKSIGDVMTITWDAIPDELGIGGQVNLRYSINGAAGPWEANTIASNVDSNLQTKDWTIPDVAGMVGQFVRVKVYKTGDEADIHAESAYDFAVKGNLILTRPSAVSGSTLTWECGTQESITWNTLGDVGFVKLYFSRDSGNDFYANPIDESGTAPAGNPTGSYLWTIPITAPPDLATVFKSGDNGKNLDIGIKLTSAVGGIESISVQPLTIKSRFINLVPNGGTITVGDSFNITWTTQGDVGTVNVKYSYDGGASYNGDVALNKTNAGGWLWNPVNSPVDNDVKVRVESSAFSDIKVDSGSNIDAKGKIQITSPSSTNRADSALIPTETHRITWVVNGGVGSNIGLVDLYYAQDGNSFGSAFTQVDTAVQNYYDWTVPSPVSLPVTTAKIKITDNSDGSVTNTSEAFDIRGKFWNGSSNRALVEPNGGEIYYVGGTDIRIQWRYKGNIGSSELYYDTASGAGGYPNLIATVAYNKNETAGVCYHDWIVPASSGVTLRVKIYAVSDPTYCYANSQANFVIKGSVLLTSPGKNPGSVETWFVDGNNQIVWGSTGGINDVDLLFDKNSGKGADDTQGTADDYGTLTIVTRAPSADGSSSYSWNIPVGQEATRQLVTTEKARVRVRDSDDSMVYSSSTNDFFMKPRITIDAVTGSPWTVQEQKTISWTKSGTVSQLNLYYSSAGQSGPWGVPQITGIDAAAGSTIWTIPDNAVSWGNAVLKLVRVEIGVEDTAVISKTGNFSIKGKINVTAPLTNQVYNVTLTGTVTWNVVGAVGVVDVKYNSNSAGSYPDPDWVAFSGATGIVPDYCTNVPGTPYTFTIPASTAPNVKIRVVESNHAEVFGPPMAGSPTHKFKGSIIFDKGNTNGQTLTVGTPHRIDWSTSGDFTTLRAYYKKIGASAWTQIGSDLGGTVTNLNYTPVDADITEPGGTDKLLFRVEDALDANDVYAETPVGQPNTVNGYLEILQPVTPNEFTVGSTVAVQWKKYGNIGNIKFELWNGSSWLTNATGSNLPDTYASGASGESGVLLVPDWAVPDKIGTGRKIRVSSINYPALTSPTGEFTIKGGLSSIDTPTTWYVGEEHIINWQANGTMSNVKIELYNGLSWTTLEDAYSAGLQSGSNSYTWSAADIKQQQRSSACKIKITSNQNPGVYIETGNFTLVPKITVTTPSQAWIAESSSNSISWNAIAAPTANVDIILEDTNSGLGYPVTLASNIVKGSSPYNSGAVIPATLTGAAKIKVRDTSFPNLVYGESGTFKVIGAIIMHPTDNTPNSTSNWEVGSSQLITWSHKGALGQINIRYKYDAGAYSAPLAGCPVAVTDHTYTWIIPDDVVSQNVQVKIESVNNPTQEYAESAAFKLRGKFTLAEPGSLNSGSSYTISWTQPLGQDARIPNVILEYYNGTSWNYIIAGVPHTVINSGSYGWTVPVDFTSSACKLRISDPNNNSGMDETNVFSILPIISVTAPTAAADWLVGTQAGNNIVWSVTGYVPTVRIEYSKDTGSNYTYIIASSVAGSSSPYEWNIPANQDIIPASAQKSKIRVIDTSLGAIYGLSGEFMVKGSIAITSPTTSSLWKISEATSIGWTTPCTLPANMGNLKIEFRKSAIDAWSEVAASVAFNSSPYIGFTLPLDSVTANVKTAQIKITQLNNTNVFVESDGFEIEGKIAINEPNTSGLIWTVGSSHNIKWTPTGTYGTVEFHYSTDNFASSNILIGQATNSASGIQGTYIWSIPTNVVSDSVRVRVRDAADADVKSISGYDVKLVGSLIVTAPNTETPKIVWYKGEAQNINWTANGAVTTVDIDYSTNGGTGWTNIITGEAGHTSGSNTKAITIPDENSENCLVKVTDSAHASVFNASVYPFAMRPVISVSQPVLDQNLVVGSNSNTIAWSLNGSTKVSFVKLYYSKDGGAYTNVIDDSGTVSATVPYTWNNI